MIEAYKIGVTLAMTSNASQVLGVLGRETFGLVTADSPFSQTTYEASKLTYGDIIDAVLGGSHQTGGDFLVNLFHHKLRI